MNLTGVTERFIEEKLGSQWQVDETQASFTRFLEYVENKTNFKPFFEIALKNNVIQKSLSLNPKGSIVLDLGSGVSWTSAIIANLPEVRHVFAVDPSKERLKHARYILKHLRVPQEKISSDTGNC